MKVELTRYRVKPGKSSKVEEWLNFLNENMEDVLVTLEGEKMYVETIFHEILNRNALRIPLPNLFDLVGVSSVFFVFLCFF